MSGVSLAELIVIGFILFVPIAIVAVVLAVVARSRKAQASNPNLTRCPDCQGLVSVRAPSCPKCGCPLKPAEGRS